MKGVPFTGAATPTAGSPAWASSWALVAAGTAKLWGMGPREQEGDRPSSVSEQRAGPKACICRCWLSFREPRGDLFPHL